MVKIGLALGGGGARGVSHIHVLEALDDLGVRPCVISGSSIGSIVGACYAAGMSGAEIREYAIQTFSKSSSVFSRLWKSGYADFGSLFDGKQGRFAEFDPLKVIRTFIPESVPHDFETLETPMKIVVTDFYGMSEMVLSEGDLYQALAATMAIPVLFRPQKINDQLVVDGGISNPVPFDVFEREVDLIVAVDVIGRPVGVSPGIPKRKELGYGTLQLFMHKITRLKLERCQPDLLVRPDVHKYRMMDFLKTGEILEETADTYHYVRQNLQKLLDRI